MATITAPGTMAHNGGLNLVPNPRPDSASNWEAVNGTSGVTSEAFHNAVGDGPTLPDGNTSNAFVRYTWTTANTGTPVGAGWAITGAGTPVVPGQLLSGGIYARSSLTLTTVRAGARFWNGSANSSVIVGTSIASVPANTWTWIPFVDIEVPAGYTSLNAARVLETKTMTVNATLDVACVLVGDLEQYIDGYMEGVSWMGTPGASTSIADATVTPVLVLDYAYSRASRNVILELLGSTYPTVFLRPAQSRSGTLSLLFSSADDARTAVDMLTAVNRYTFTETAVGEQWDFIVAGDVANTKVEGVEYWIVNVTVREVATL